MYSCIYRFINREFVLILGALTQATNILLAQLANLWPFSTKSLFFSIESLFFHRLDAKARGYGDETKGDETKIRKLWRNASHISSSLDEQYRVWNAEAKFMNVRFRRGFWG